MTPRQDEILQTAKKLFVERGYTETSMRDLAAELNIKAASLYNHFKSKEEILEFILTSVSLRFKTMRINLENAATEPHTRFESFLRMYIEEILKDIYGFELYLSYWKINSHFLTTFEEGRNAYLQFVKKLLDDMEVKTNLQVFKPEAPVFIVLAALNTVPMLLNNREDINVQEAIDELIGKIKMGFGLQIESK